MRVGTRIRDSDQVRSLNGGCGFVGLLAENDAMGVASKGFYPVFAALISVSGVGLKNAQPVEDFFCLRTEAFTERWLIRLRLW